MSGGGEEGKTLEYTPTWVVAAVCTVIVAISLALERLLHYGGKFLKKKGQKPLYEALQKVKEELMLLGFISLLLTVFQNVISKICVQHGVMEHLLPCKLEDAASETATPTSHFTLHFRRLAEETAEEQNTYCAKTGMKIRQWKTWEDDIAKQNYDSQQFINKKHKFTQVHEHAFIRERFLGMVAVGTKLEHVITQLAHEVAEKHIAIEGDLVVTPSDGHFWFGKPKLVLFLIHFILFQNAFEIAFFFWIWVQYGFDSCIMGQVRFIVPRLVIGVFIQVLCSYSTLPLYAIITQMGSSFKKAIFDEHVQVGLVGWAQKVKKKKAAAAADASGSGSGSGSGSVQPSSHGGSISSAFGIQMGKLGKKTTKPEENNSDQKKQEENN
ncbi:PREDICTED: MLO-like protein 1-like isoform 3 [Fragaria vesca subsp. vesca]